MKKIINKKIEIWMFLTIIAFFSISASVILGVKTVSALAVNFGGRVVWVGNCQISQTLGVAGCLPMCPMCTADLHDGCQAVDEIDFIPYGGTPGITHLCIPKGYPYRGGYPRIGSTIYGNGLSHILLIFQAGIGF